MFCKNCGFNLGETPESPVCPACGETIGKIAEKKSAGVKPENKTPEKETAQDEKTEEKAGGKKTGNKKPRRKLRKVLKALGIAASCVLVAGSVWLVWRYQSTKIEGRLEEQGLEWFKLDGDLEGYDVASSRSVFPEEELIVVEGERNGEGVYPLKVLNFQREEVLPSESYRNIYVMPEWERIVAYDGEFIYWYDMKGNEMGHAKGPSECEGIYMIPESERVIGDFGDSLYFYDADGRYLNDIVGEEITMTGECVDEYFNIVRVTTDKYKEEFRKPYYSSSAHFKMIGNRFVISRKVYEGDDWYYVYGIIDENGNEVIPFTNTRADWFQDGKTIIKTQEGRINLIDADGNILLAFRDTPYRGVSDMMDGRYITVNETPSDTWEDDPYQWGVISIDNPDVMIVPGQYRDSFRWTGNGFIAENENGYGVLDINGNEIIPCQFYSIFAIENGYEVRKEDGYGKCGVMGTDGREIIPCEYDSVWAAPGGGCYIGTKEIARSDEFHVTYMHTIFSPDGEVKDSYQSFDWGIRESGSGGNYFYIYSGADFYEYEDTNVTVFDNQGEILVEASGIDNFRAYESRFYIQKNGEKGIQVTAYDCQGNMRREFDGLDLFVVNESGIYVAVYTADGRAIKKVGNIISDEPEQELKSRVFADRKDMVTQIWVENDGIRVFYGKKEDKAEIYILAEDHWEEWFALNGVFVGRMGYEGSNLYTIAVDRSPFPSDIYYIISP